MSPVPGSRATLVLVLALACASAIADTHYVTTNGLHTSPYTSPVNAATNIQSATDKASAGDVVLVADGIYSSGWTIVQGQTRNRIAVTNSITVRSVNGPRYTIITGQGPRGDSAVRCAYVGGGAKLIGITLTNGHTRTNGVWSQDRSGGGAWCETTAIVSNCVVTGNSADYGGGSYNGTIQDCTIAGNSANYGGGTCYGTFNNCRLLGNSATHDGGGMYGSTIKNCLIFDNAADNGGGTCYGTIRDSTIASNSASRGGGTYAGTINACTITSNSVDTSGGGAYSSTINNCTISANSAYLGGGACYGTVSNSTIAANFASLAGGGTAWVTVNNCLILNNSAYSAGGGTYDGTINNCTVIYNSADHRGAGTADGTVTNSVVYYNFVGAQTSNWSECTVVHSCTTPDPGGPGNITGKPCFADYAGGKYHLLSISPCINTGTNLPWMPGATDLDGNARIVNGTVDMGAHEFIILPGATHYVTTNGLSVSPYTDPFHAATNIQDAIDAATNGQTVLVADGVYNSGWTVMHGQMRNRVAITNGVTVRSVSGPDHTFITGESTAGDAAVRCAYVGSNTCLAGFTLMNGNTRTAGDVQQEQSGGGAWCETGAVVSNCIIRNNSAEWYGGGTFGGTARSCMLAVNSARLGAGTYAANAWHCVIASNTASVYGGGAYGSTIYNSVLFANSAFNGGGTYYGTILNSTITGNTAQNTGGGTYDGTIRNSIVYYNSAEMAGDNYSGGTYGYSCTRPAPVGAGNITNEPGFTANACADHSLALGSGCINAGTNEAWMSSTTDLAGHERIIHGVVDMGACEFMDLVAAALYSPTLTVTTNRPSFAWAAIDYASWYYLWINRNGNVCERRWVNGTNTWLATQDMWGGEYRWWVRAWNADGYGPWSMTGSFTIPPRIPTNTVLGTPSGTIVTNQPSFAWQSVDSATWYRLWINRNATRYLVKWLQATNYTLTSSIPLGDYQWWVRTWNPDGYGPWSSPTTFAYGVSTPLWPTGSITGTRQPEFSWSIVPGATWHRLWLNKTGQPCVSHWVQGSNTWTFATNLPLDNYRWWVRTWNPDGFGPWSSGAQFVLQ